MAKRRTLLAERLRLDTSLKETQALVRKIGNFPYYRWVRDLRKSLHMSQKQLAKRAKITQPQLSKIESGQAKITLETLERVFNALFCTAWILPLPNEDLGDVMKQRAKLTAKKKLESLVGSMALEEQLPSKEHLEKKIEEVADDLMRSGSTEIWDL